MGRHELNLRIERRSRWPRPPTAHELFVLTVSSHTKQPSEPGRQHGLCTTRVSPSPRFIATQTVVQQVAGFIDDEDSGPKVGAELTVAALLLVQPCRVCRTRSIDSRYEVSAGGPIEADRRVGHMSRDGRIHR